MGFFTRPEVCDEVAGVNASGVRESGSIIGQLEVKFPEDPRGFHRTSILRATTFAGLITGLGIWALASAWSNNALSGF